MKISLLYLFSFAFLLASCSMYERTFKNIRNSSSTLHQNVSAISQQASPIAVVTNGPWSAKVVCEYLGVSQDLGMQSDNNWLSIYPSSGQDPGLHKIDVGLNKNISSYSRVAYVEVECMGETLTYVIEQESLK